MFPELNLIKLVPYLIGAVLVGLLVWGVVHYFQQVEQTKQELVQVTKERDAAIKVAEDNKKEVAKQKKVYEATIAALSAEQHKSTERVQFVTQVKKEIEYVPVTTECMHSPAVSHVLDRLRQRTSTDGDAGTTGTAASPGQ